MSMKVLKPGLLTSIQDLGRYGYQKHGVIVSGAMDSYSLRIANLLVGNEEDEAALEITLMGPTLRIEQDSLLAITGGDLSPTVDGKSIPMWRPVYVKSGSVIQFGACKLGCRSYLAVAGGYDVPEVMGSRSTYLRAGVGGYQGRALKEGDQLSYKFPFELSIQVMQNLIREISSSSFFSTSWSVGREYIPQDSLLIKVRVMRGSQFEQFTVDSRNQFFSSPFQVTPQSDRMGYRLSGPILELAEPLEMISEAVSLGTIQVPSDGNPIILLADRQTVGGYPRIAQVIQVDIPVIAQMKPGSKILFQEISLDEAEELYFEKERSIQDLKAGIRLRLK
ncbi:MAG TPA: biotin-dependent carboxyltransferase family protein [Bacillota bacterium]|nr:biotin-dependent carboxyltransferase family protein [Bacillota bacterium]